MPSDQSFIQQLNPTIFWDVDIRGLDPQTNKRLIIERVFSLGELHEMKKLIGFYGNDEVLKVLCDLPCLDPKTMNFISHLFNKPLETFRCYQRKQSGPSHWNS